MRKFKITAVIILVAVLLGVYFSSAFALSDGINALEEFFGRSNTTAANEEEADPDENDEVDTTSGNSQANLDSGLMNILESLIGSAANSLSTSQLMDILRNFDINALMSGDSDVIDELMDMIGGNQSTRSGNDEGGNQSATPSQSYTVPQYTNVYVTDAPAVTYSYTPGTTVAGGAAATTAPGETTTLYYIAPSTVYAEQITTLPYDYQVETTEISQKDGVTLKTIIGISILLISGVAVVGVALSLKKSKV